MLAPVVGVVTVGSAGVLSVKLAVQDLFVFIVIDVLADDPLQPPVNELNVYPLPAEAVSDNTVPILYGAATFAVNVPLPAGLTVRARVAVVAGFIYVADPGALQLLVSVPI